jgi:alanine-synthesizing transaminase
MSDKGFGVMTAGELMTAFDEYASLKEKLLSEGTDIIDLSMINPDIPPPRLLIDRLLEATLKTHNQRYAVSRGIRRVRESFAEKYQERFGVVVDPEDHVCVTFGTKDALNLLMHVFLRRSHTILLPSPTYPAFIYAARYAGLAWDFYSIGLDEASTLRNIQKKLEEKKYGAIFLNFPNNPTGACVSKKFYAGLAELANQFMTYVVNDFVYGELLAPPAQPISLLTETAFGRYGLETYSLSKAYSVPGWRVGALLGSAEVVGQVAQLKSQVDYGLYLPLQIAASAALSAGNELVDDIAQEYSRRSQTLRSILERQGWQIPYNTTACSLWAKLPDREDDDEVYVRRALRLGVSLTPGSRFGNDYDRFVRFALVAPEERIRLVEERIFQ